jgi:hypothetical protein
MRKFILMTAALAGTVMALAAPSVSSAATLPTPARIVLSESGGNATPAGPVQPAVGRAAVTPAATCTPTTAEPLCGVEVFAGGGDKTPVAEPLPAPGGITASTAPKKIEVADANVTTTLTMDVASLEKPYGDCASDCSDWWVYHNGALQVNSFSWDQPTGTVTGHYLTVPTGSSNWQDMGNGIYTPLYFQWLWTNSAGTLTHYYCMHLDLPTKAQPKATYDWSLISQSNTPNCP